MKTLTTIITIALLTISTFTFAAKGVLTDVNPSGRMAFGIDENGTEVIFVNPQGLPIFNGAIVEFEKKGNGKGGNLVNEVTGICFQIGDPASCL